LLALSVGAIYQEYQRIERGEAAKGKLLIAMRVAGAKLQQARDRVSKVEATEVQ
jgi:ABC-type ATPase involved in cell division